MFSTFCAISCDSRAHFFATAQWKGLRNEMALEITSVGDEKIYSRISVIIIPALNLRQDLDNYSKCEDCERDSAYVKHRSECVFDKSSDEEM